MGIVGEPKCNMRDRAGSETRILMQGSTINDEENCWHEFSRCCAITKRQAQKATPVLKTLQRLRVSLHLVFSVLKTKFCPWRITCLFSGLEQTLGLGLFRIQTGLTWWIMHISTNPLPQKGSGPRTPMKYTYFKMFFVVLFFHSLQAHILL
jgi:hypothetical protein